MIDLLAKLFILRTPDLSPVDVRRRYGVLCGGLGIVLNLLLSAGKLAAGVISGSIAITADALNNLSDAGSSIVTLVGFRLAGKQPDADHPFGHGRFEYIAGMVVAMLILVMGVELLISSVRKIFSPQPVLYSPLVLAILFVSALVKLYMMLYNRRIGRRFQSSALLAAAADSLNDCIATGVVFLCGLLSRSTALPLDAYAGVLVSLFILYTGFTAARQIVSQILGNPPDPELVEKIEQIVLDNAQIVGIHDMMIHDYGPGNCVVSLHAEVPQEGDILELHDVVDQAEMRLHRELGCQAVIHMDPIATRDEAVLRVRSQVVEKLKTLDPGITIHDFRMVPGSAYSRVLFDVAAPYSLKLSDEEIGKQASRLVQELDPKFLPMVSVDRVMVRQGQIKQEQ